MSWTDCWNSAYFFPQKNLAAKCWSTGKTVDMQWNPLNVLQFLLSLNYLHYSCYYKKNLKCRHQKRILKTCGFFTFKIAIRSAQKITNPRSFSVFQSKSVANKASYANIKFCLIKFEINWCSKRLSELRNKDNHCSSNSCVLQGIAISALVYSFKRYLWLHHLINHKCVRFISFFQYLLSSTLNLLKKENIFT